MHLPEASGALRLVTAARLLEPGGTVLRAAGLVVDAGSGRIVDVGPRQELVRLYPDTTADDWGDVLLIPGLINGHAHTFQSLLRGLGDDLTFTRWRDEVLYPSVHWLTLEDLETGALLASADMLLAGITTVAEFFYMNDQGNASAEAVIAGLVRSGIRTVFGRALYDGVRAPSRYRESPRAAFERLLDLAQRHADDPLVRVVAAPHSLHAASPEAIRLGAEAAERLDSVFTIHAAEGEYEVANLKAATGQGPAAYLDGLGALSPRTVLVHGVRFRDEDLDRIAARGAAIVHNPGANAFLGDGIAPLLGMRQRGIPVALGTDGGCTNNRLSILDEVRLAPLLQRALYADGSLLTAREAFAMATTESARVFNLDIGALQPGGLADVVALDLDDPSLMPETDLLSSVAYSAQSRAVRRVMVHGRDVVVNGRLVQLPVGELRERVNATLGRARAGGYLPR